MERKLLIQPVTVVGIKIREGVMVDLDPTAQPPIGAVGFTQVRNPPGAGLMVDRRVQPHRHEKAGIDRRTPGLPFDGLHLRIQCGKVQTTDQGPHDPRRMVVIDPVVDPSRQWVFALAVRTP